MSELIWGWIVLGSLTIGNLWVVLTVVLNVLKKLERCEEKLVAMTEAYPHAALIAMQREGIAAQQQAWQRAQHGTPQEAPDWQMQEAS